MSPPQTQTQTQTQTPTPPLHLTTASVLGKYLLIYAYDTQPVTRLSTVEVLYDMDLPWYDVCMTKEQRKTVQMRAAGPGTHRLRDPDGLPLVLTVEDHWHGRAVMDHDGALVYRITLALAVDPAAADHVQDQAQAAQAAHARLCAYVDAAKAHVEARMQSYRASDRTVTRYIYNEKYHEWEVLNAGPLRAPETVFLPAACKQRLVDAVRAFVAPATKADYHTYCIPYKMNVLLHGKPGTGKTSTIHALASMIESDICIFSFSHTFDDAQMMRAVNHMRGIGPRARILVMEDIDCMFQSRKEHDTAKNAVTLSGLLNILDGLVRPEGILVFLTANHIGLLDKALLRPGRIDVAVRYDGMTADQLRAMFLHYCPGLSPRHLDAFAQALAYKDVQPSLLQEFLFRHRALAKAEPDKLVGHLEELVKLVQERAELQAVVEGGSGGERERSMYM
jgi:hypothetical protein